MAIKAISKPVYDCACERCGAVWISYKVPKRCRKCRTPLWNIPKRSKSDVKEQERR